MKKLFLACAFAAATIAHAATPVSYEAYTVATYMMDKGWSRVAPFLDKMAEELEGKFKEGGANDRAAKSMSVSMKQNLNKDAFIKLTAEEISAKMSMDEQRSTLAFINSPAGQKFFDVTNFDDETSMRVIRAAAQASCSYSKAALDPKDFATLQKVCGDFR